MSTKTSTAAKAAEVTGTPADDQGAKATGSGGRGSRRSRRGQLEKINAKVVALNQFARKWEPVFSESAVGAGTDIVKAAAKNVAEKLSQIIATTDATSTFLETLKTSGWKAPKARGKRDHREGDFVDMKDGKAKQFTKSGFKAAALKGFKVGKVAGGMVTVDNGQLAGTYPAAWFVRGTAPAAK